MTMLEQKFGHQDHTSTHTWMRNDEDLEMILHRMLRQFTALCRASIIGYAQAVALLHSAEAMSNLDGGAEGMPLVGACKADDVKRNTWCATGPAQL